jgi:hypothetical protein
MEGKVGRVLAVTNGSDFREGIRKKTIGREIVIGPNAIKFVAIIIFAILALVYLAQSTAGANRSVKVRDMEDRKAKLELEEERLQVEQTRLKSLKEIESGIEKPTMEPVSQVNHVE